MMPVITRDSIPTDKEVKRLLLNGDNVPILEDVLDRESERFQHLKRLKNYTPRNPTFKEIFSDTSKLNFGPRLDADELKEEFQKVKGKVDRFLGVRESSYPTVVGGRFSSKPLYNGMYTVTVAGVAIPFVPLGILEMIPDPTDPITMPLGALLGLPLMLLAGSYYRGGKSRIRISHFDSKRTNAIPILAHEYVHHVQNRRIGCLKYLSLREALRDAPKNYAEFKVFEEGHARGVEKAVAKQYVELEDNPAFEYGVLERAVPELRSVYRWACKKLGLTPNKHLGKVSWPIDSHALGTALFSILEAQQGPDVYRRALKPA